MRLLDRQDVLLDFTAQYEAPRSDALGKDAASVPGSIARFRAALSSLKTKDAGEVDSITTPFDVRRRLGSPPDESIFVKRVARDGSAIEGEIGSYLVGKPRPSAELTTRQGSLLTVMHRSRGAA